MCDSQPNRVAPPILPHTLQLSINHIPMLFLSLTSLPPKFDYPPKDPTDLLPSFTKRPSLKNTKKKKRKEKRKLSVEILKNKTKQNKKIKKRTKDLQKRR